MTALHGAGGATAALGVALADGTASQGRSGGCESVQEILNIAATAEALEVTALGGALANVASGVLVLDPEAVQALTAAQAADQAHYEFLIESGAQPLTLTFTVPDPAIVTDPATFLTTVVALEEAVIAAYIAAAQTFSVLGETGLAQVALQIGAVEAEHRAGVRFFAIQAGVLSGTPNDVAFEKALYTRVGQAAETLQQLGFIGGAGTEITYPGPLAIDFTGVGRLRP